MNHLIVFLSFTLVRALGCPGFARADTTQKCPFANKILTFYPVSTETTLRYRTARLLLFCNFSLHCIHFFHFRKTEWTVTELDRKSLHTTAEQEISHARFGGLAVIIAIPKVAW